MRVRRTSSPLLALRSLVTVAAAMLSLGGIVAAQEEAADDAIGQQAAALEAELGKYKDSAPEAAEAMVKLVDLYHADGRLFGLVRVGQQFVASHPTDPRHKAVMLKLIDGQEALSRNKEVSVSIRQFIALYPDAAENPALEVRLADALKEFDDRRRVADACWAVWQRQGGNETGRRYGATAVQMLSTLNNAEASALAAERGEEMLNKLGGEFARELGWLAFHEYRRVGQWAKSTAVGTKLLQKGLGGDPETQRQIHLTIAENHANLGQHANAAQSLRQVRKLRDDQVSHYQLIYRLSLSAAKPGELEPVVNEYTQKYPQRSDRFHGVSYLALSCLANNEKPRALNLLASLLADDPVFNGNASVFVRENGAEPAQLADSEQKLIAAIGQNKPGAYYLRYVLALDLYRDRLAEPAKAKQVLRELISQAPSNDGHTTGPIDWLLYNSADDNEFKSDLALVLAARKQHPHLGMIGEAVKNWSQNARQNKDFVARANIAAEELKKSNADPLIAAWMATVSPQHAPGEAARNKLLEPAMFNQLNEAAARTILQMQADFYRHYAPATKRVEMVRVYKQFTEKFPQDIPAATGWLESSTDYGQPADMKAAAEHFLKFPAEARYGDLGRRLMVAADKNEDANLARSALNWINQANEKHGADSTAAAQIGDILLKLGLETEAAAHWTMGMTSNRQSTESRECASRLLARLKDSPPAERIPLLQELVKHDTDMHGRYAQWLAHEHFTAGDVGNFERVLRETHKRQQERPLRAWDIDYWQVAQWLDATRANMEMKDDVKRRIITAIRDLRLEPASSTANLALLESTPIPEGGKMQRLLELQKATRLVGDDWPGWDRLTPFAQNAVGKKDYMSAAVIATGMLSNIPNVDEPRKKAARDLVTQALSRMGGVGLAIDDSSPLAPLMQAAMYYRLGDERLAFDAYVANKALFDENRNQLPPDLLVFVCDRLIAAGDDSDHDYVEELLRGWLVAFSESMQHDDATKARMQLLLARNFFKAQRFDVARAEYNTVVNRYAETPEAIEAEFGIGETFLAQKVYDQAENVFEKLARSSEIDVVVRAEFLRGVLAFRRGDRDEARDIFKGVLERVPNVELANQALFNLAEVYGSEERYIDQLNLLRTVGRLGRHSKRRHVPGMPLSIVVHDSDLGISRGHNRIPVRVTTEPGGDSETIYLVGSGAGKGLFRADLDTRLGEAKPGDGVLQLTGKDTIKCDYPDEFKSEFKNVPLSDVEIRVASDARFEVSSSKIEDAKQETLSEQLAREQEQERADRRVSQARPANQIKPGNPIYIRVKDADRDLSSEIDEVVVKLTADSGDQIQVTLRETEPHSGVFEGTAQTGDLPAGALASDTAIDHSPLMAIDRDPQSYWMSEPDGAAPKWLTIDMKDLREVTRAKIASPDAAQRAPVRGDLLGSQDGQFWFRIASYPEREPALPLAGEFAVMTRHNFNGDLTGYTVWDQVVALTKNTKPVESTQVENLQWKRPEESQDAAQPYAVVWQGKFIQPKSGAVRILVNGGKTAILVDGLLELAVGPGGRSIDLWLEAGPHDLAIFAASNAGQQPVEALLARADLTSEQVTLLPFRASDFDLESPAAKKELPSNNGITVPLLVNTATFEKKTEQFGVHPVGDSEAIGYWQAPEDIVKWEFEAPAAGPYDVWLEFSHEGEGGSYQVGIGEKAISGKVPNTGNWTTYRKQKIATVLLDKPGKHSLTIKPVEIVGAGLMSLKEASLVQATGATTIVEPANWEFRFPKQELRYVRFVCQEYLGEALAISNVEVAGEGSELYIPTEEDVLALAANDTLEIAGGDTVVASYTDELTLNETAGSQLLLARLQATYFNASVTPIAYDFDRAANGQVYTIRKELKRIDPGERITVEIVDYDEDRSSSRDTVPFQIMVNDGEPLDFEATETEAHTGTFTKEIDTTAGNEPAKLKVKPGDRIAIRYLDTHNTFPGHSVPREDVVYVASPTSAVVRVLETRVIPPPEGTKQPPQLMVLPKREREVAGVAFEAPLTVEVIDPDAAKDSRSSVVVSLVTTDGASVDVECQISSRFADFAAAGPISERRALEEGRFLGQVIMQLGGKNSPAIVPLTTDMPRDLVGKARLGEKATGDNAAANLVTRVLNLSGKDVVTATYNDERHPGGSPKSITSQARLISNGQLLVTDRDYDKPIAQLHVGERMYLKVIDPDLDTSDARDFATVEITTALGEKETVKLEETLSHSGEFTGSVQLKAVEQPTPGNFDPASPAIETYFGDTVTVTFVDPTASTESGTLEQVVEIPVVVGTDGLVAAFSKTFTDETLAVETKFRIAESYFELFKSHKALGREEERKLDLESGRRVLQEVMEDYPDPKYAPRIAYLLGQFAQELEQWDEAIRSYDLILRQYGEHTLAPDAQYKLAQCYEQAGDFDEALEAYVTLAATHPKSPLIPNVMIRISDHFYKNEQYDVAAQVGEKFIERFESHSNAPRMAFRIGQCYFKAKKFAVAGESFDRFCEVFPKDALAADAMFWSGESYRMGSNNHKAFMSYLNCKDKYPESEAAKFARGRLALPEMLQQFEAEANSVDE
jgi:TolA-binding protein